MSWTRKNRWVLIVLTFIRWNRNKPFTFFLSFHLLYKTLVFLNRDNLVWNRRRTELSSAGCPSADTDVLTDEEEEEELISQYFLFGFCSVEKWSVLVSSLFPLLLFLFSSTPHPDCFARTSQRLSRSIQFACCRLMYGKTNLIYFVYFLTQSSIHCSCCFFFLRGRSCTKVLDVSKAVA